MNFDLLSAYKKIRHWFGDDGQILIHNRFGGRIPQIRISVYKLGTSFNSEFTIEGDDTFEIANQKFKANIQAINRMIEDYKIESKH